MRKWLVACSFVALAGGSVSTNAALLTTGQAGHPANPPYGGFLCADVSAGSTRSGTPIQVFDCTGAPNQQFEFNSLTIYPLGGQGCMDVSGGRTTDGTPVQFWTCNGTGAQQWTYDNGSIVNLNSNKCLDATNLNNGRQLVINTCNGSVSQNWQIK